MTPGDHPTADPRPPGPVVVGVDGSRAAQHAVRWAARTAAARGHTLRIVHGLGLGTTGLLLGSDQLGSPGVLDTLRQKGADCVGAAVALAREVAPGLDIDTEIADAGAARVLIEQSRDAHLVVLGVSGSGGALTRLGSTLIAVVAHGHGAIVVVRGEEENASEPAAQPVVVGVDGNPAGQAAVRVAFAEADARGVPLVAVHAWSDLPVGGLPGTMPELDDMTEAEAHRTLQEQLTRCQDRYPDVVVVRKAYLSGPRDRLIGWSRSAQLLVVGSRGRGGFRGLLLGSTSQSLVQQAHCPVMVVHQD
ncbi:universal stress protein [Nocardia blacklockiae]|uniref:universal stress protein n=1 Tax=Nocardia blacklockiae TaxID=480036 RepID=UPI001892E5ED|nr:universal stress protein [Nocardia blacklockiae]MBF6171892.1 universal stress protein [Nocardia blacklockiae]